jgi:hypothetical protein
VPRPSGAFQAAIVPVTSFTEVCGAGAGPHSSGAGGGFVMGAERAGWIGEVVSTGVEPQPASAVSPNKMKTAMARRLTRASVARVLRGAKPVALRKKDTGSAPETFPKQNAARDLVARARACQR